MLSNYMNDRVLHIPTYDEAFFIPAPQRNALEQFIVTFEPSDKFSHDKFMFRELLKKLIGFLHSDTFFNENDAFVTESDTNTKSIRNHS